jgi:hypothetical protein
MGIFLAVIVIVALIFYAAKELLVEKDFPAWTNIALTALILFTVILSIYMILRKPYDANVPKDTAVTTEAAPTSSTLKTPMPEAEMTDDDIMLAIAEEYLIAQDQYKAEYPSATDSEEVATKYIINKYEFTPEDWQTFLSGAANNDSFNNARARITGQGDVNYLIPTSK